MATLIHQPSTVRGMRDVRPGSLESRVCSAARSTLLRSRCRNGFGGRTGLTVLEMMSNVKGLRCRCCARAFACSSRLRPDHFRLNILVASLLSFPCTGCATPPKRRSYPRCLAESPMATPSAQARAHQHRRLRRSPAHCEIRVAGADPCHLAGHRTVPGPVEPPSRWTPWGPRVGAVGRARRTQPPPLAVAHGGGNLSRPHRLRGGAWWNPGARG